MTHPQAITTFYTQLEEKSKRNENYRLFHFGNCYRGVCLLRHSVNNRIRKGRMEPHWGLKRMEDKEFSEEYMFNKNQVFEELSYLVAPSDPSGNFSLERDIYLYKNDEQFKLMSRCRTFLDRWSTHIYKDNKKILEYNVKRKPADLPWHRFDEPIYAWEDFDGNKGECWDFPELVDVILDVLNKYFENKTNK